MPKTRTLYRPVGLREVLKILETDASRFPPRLPEQPIFYPVLNREYAEQIAERWNTKAAPGYAGFVTEFAVDARYASRFKSHVVGSSLHRELWVPAEQLDDFNAHIVGPIGLVSAHYGPDYVGPPPVPGMLHDLAARDQLPQLAHLLDSNGADFTCEVRTQRTLVQLNFAYWVRTDFTGNGIPLTRKLAVLNTCRDVWNEAFQETALVGSSELDAFANT